MSTQTILTILLLISPIFLIQLGMAIYSLLDLFRRKTVRGPRWAWTVALLLSALALPSGILVSALYLYWGRHTGLEEDDDSD